MASRPKKVPAKRKPRRPGTTRLGAAASDQPNGDFLVVCLGASAGGLAALTSFFSALPGTPNFALVVVQHLDPLHESTLAQLLSAHCSLPFVTAEDGMEIEAGSVYIIAPGAYLTVQGSRLRSAKAKPPLVRLPIDHFLQSLALAFGNRAAAVILSGTGTDGTQGVRSIKENGGLVVVQDPADAAYDGMPNSAVATGAADVVLPALDIPAALHRYAARRGEVSTDTDTLQDTGVASILADVITLLKLNRRHDFSLYKPAMLMRRIERRIALHTVENPREYLAHLSQSTSEQDALFQDFLINVTNFFRDTAAFDHLRKSIVPDIIKSHDFSRALRAWVPACSSGEEAYSIAMTLIEGLTAAGKDVAVQVFATDVDAGALEVGRRGVYPDSIESSVSPERLQRFFTRQDHSYVVQAQLRDCLVFATHNLLTDAPFSNLDLISCRNLLIYLRPEVQDRVLRLLHYSLEPGGTLFLGPSESLGGEQARFRTVSQEHRIYQRIGLSTPIDLGRPIQTAIFDPKTVTPHGALSPLRPTSLSDLCRQALVQSYAPASVLIDKRGEGRYFIGAVDRFLRVATGDASQIITSMAREGLRAKLRSAIHVARSGDGHASVGGAFLRHDQQAYSVSIEVQPLSVEGDQLLLVSFVDQLMPEADTTATGSELSSADASATVARLEQEIETTRNELQATIRDLEASNEEFKVVNEEAMSLNEEFQSTNEELETSKEELQSVNEELTTLNAELQEKIELQRRTNDDLSNLLGSTDIATLFLDRNLNIRFFTPTARPIFAIIDSDVGRPLADLAHDVNDLDLLADAEKTMAELVPIQRDVTNEKGRWFIRRIRPYRTEDDKIDGVVITFSDITELKTSEQSAMAAKSFAEGIVDTIRQPLLVLDQALNVVSASRSFCQVFHLTPDEVEGRAIADIGGGQMNALALTELLERILPERTTIEDFEVELSLPAYGRRQFLVNARRLERENGLESLILLALEDVTERKYTVGEMLQEMLEATADAVLLVSPDGKIAHTNEGARTLFGYGADDMIGQPLENLIPERLRDQHRQHLSQFFANPEPRLMGRETSLEIIGLDRSGREIPLQVSLAMVKATVHPFAVATIRDVSEEHRAAREVKEARDAAEEASRRKSEFLTVVSQDLRQRVQTLGILDGVLARTVIQKESRELVGRLSVVTDAMTDALNTLLDLDQIERGEITPLFNDFCIHDTIARMGTEFSHVASTKRLDFRVVPSNLGVHSDAFLLDRILQNFVSNALRHASSGRVLIGCRRRGDTVRIEVWDTGPGMPADLLDVVFTPDYHLSTDIVRRHDGLGLGLYLVSRIAELLGHRIDVRSTLGKGSMFAVELPAAQGSVDLQSTVLPVYTGESNSVEILLLTELVETADMFALLLKLEGYVVRVVSGSEDVRSLLQNSASLPALIIANHHLGGDMEGLEVVQAIRRHSGIRIPAIILTVDVSAREVQKIASSECTVLVKPVKADDLVAHTHKLLRESGAPLPSDLAPEQKKADSRATVFIVGQDVAIGENMAGCLSDVGHRVETFADAERFLATFDRRRPGCVLTAINMPGMSGLELQQTLKNEGCRIPLVLATERQNMSQAVAGIHAGALDVLEHPIDSKRLIGAVEAALVHGKEFAADTQARDEALTVLGRLTPRERSILTLLVAGHQTKEIAAQLGISPRTVENHRAQIRVKTGARSLADLVRMAALIHAGH